VLESRKIEKTQIKILSDFILGQIMTNLIEDNHRLSISPLEKGRVEAADKHNLFVQVVRPI